MFIRTCSVAVCLAGMATATTANSAAAHDQKVTSDDAHKLIDRGVELREKRQDEEALHLFTHAYEASRAPRALAQMAMAEQALGRWVDAESHLVTAVESATDPWIRKNRSYLDAALGNIRTRLADLEVTGGIPDAEIRVDGRLAGKLPLARPVRIVAGTVALEVSRPGYYTVRRTVTVAAQGIAREIVSLVPDPTVQATANPSVLNAQPGPRAAPSLSSIDPSPAAFEATSPSDATVAATADRGTHWSWQRKLGVGLLGGGAAALVLGVIAHAARQSAATDFAKAGCGTADPSVGVGCQDRYDAVKRDEKLMIVGYLGAAALAGAGSYFFWFAPNQPAASSSNAGGSALVVGLGGSY